MVCEWDGRNIGNTYGHLPGSTGFVQPIIAPAAALGQKSIMIIGCAALVDDDENLRIGFR